MGLYAILAVGGGAAIGAWLRWWLGILFNPIFPTVPFGTLAANLVGGYLIGLAIAYFAQHANVPPEARLFIITGFLGGLTTFSTFSAETVSLLARSQFSWALVIVSAHLFGSLGMTALGILTMKFFKA